MGVSGAVAAVSRAGHTQEPRSPYLQRLDFDPGQDSSGTGAERPRHSRRLPAALCSAPSRPRYRRTTRLRAPEMGQDNSHPEPGDLIEIFRPGYQHWALYMGDGYVINVTPVDEGAPTLSVSIVSVFTRKAKVKKQLLKEVVGNDKWRVNNKYDRSRTPRPVKEIIRSAERWIDREVSYDVLGSNCEHFVTELRYGEGVSDQVTKVIGTTAAVGGIILAGIAATVVKGFSEDSSRRERNYY